MVFNTFTIAGNGLLNLTENLFKYYSTSLFGSHDRQSHLDNPTPASTSSARGLLFNQAFAVAKDFFEKASLNTVRKSLVPPNFELDLFTNFSITGRRFANSRERIYTKSTMGFSD
jgi:hypothetical protein